MQRKRRALGPRFSEASYSDHEAAFSRMIILADKQQRWQSLAEIVRGTARNDLPLDCRKHGTDDGPRRQGGNRRRWWHVNDRVKIDNNTLERILRPIALNRNYAAQVIMRSSLQPSAARLHSPGISGTTNCA